MKKRDGIENVLSKLSKANKDYERKLAIEENSRILTASKEMITSEGFLFGGFSCFEAAALLFCDQMPEDRFNFEISYTYPVALEQSLSLIKDSETKVAGSVGKNQSLIATTSSPLPRNNQEVRTLQATVMGIKESEKNVITYESCKHQDLETLFHLCCFFDRGTWFLGQKKFQHANFLTGSLFFDVSAPPAQGPLHLKAKNIVQKRKGGSSLIVKADAIDSNQNTFANVECTLIRICPETKRPLALFKEEESRLKTSLTN